MVFLKGAFPVGGELRSFGMGIKGSGNKITLNPWGILWREKTESSLAVSRCERLILTGT